MYRDYVIIVGAMKSGTTTLFDVLAEHPQIAPASNKEPGFFAFEEVWSKGFDWYDALFKFDPATHRYRLEASTDYTKAPFVSGVWERMTADSNVRVKLLYIMRHPLQRMESHARHVQSAQKEIGQRPASRSDHSLDAGLSLTNVITSRYASQLDVFASAREAGNLHYLTLEELKANPKATLDEIYEFLDLPPGSYAIPQSNAAAKRTRVSPMWKRVTGLPFVTKIAHLLPNRIRDTLRTRFRMAPVKTRGRFRFSEVESEAVIELLQDDIDRLRSDYGIDTMRHWRIGHRSGLGRGAKRV